jgi:putative glycosyltransferase
MVDYPLHANQVTCRLMSRRFVAAALETTDRVVMLGELWAWVGFKQVPQEVEKRLTDGQSKTAYSLRKRLRLAVNAISSTSAAPLAGVFVTGTAVAALSLLVAVATFVWRLRNGITDGTGFATLLISVWFLGGLTLAAVGLVGLYLSRLFDQMRRRPVFVIADMD